MYAVAMTQIAPQDQQLADLAYHAKTLAKAYADKQRNAGRRQRLTNWDAVEILHAIARYMTIHNVE